MKENPVAHLSNAVLRRELVAIVSHDRSTTARLLIHMAEFASRKLYLEDGYPSMFAYCVGELRMSEDVAYKRIRVARAARRFPRTFTALADGSLTLSAVALLARHLTQDTAKELLAASAGKTNDQVRHLLAERFPQPDLPTCVVAIDSHEQLAVRPVLDTMAMASQPVVVQTEPVPPSSVESLVFGQDADSRPRVTPLSPQRYSLQLTMSQTVHDKLRHAQELLGHQIPAGDVVQVLDRALDALIAQLEKAKFAATDKPRPQKAGNKGRYVPAQVRRAVRERDGGRCTFVGENGHHCEARKMLEFDHVREFARGGEATVENVRLRCRAHNQFTAEQTYGSDLMNRRPEAARREAAEKRARVVATAAEKLARAKAAQEAAAREHARQAAEEVIPWLRALGFRGEQARYAAERCEAIPDASLEDRVKAALSCLAPRAAMRAPAPA